MTTLALQIFLLLLASYLLGAMVACMVRRAFYTQPAKAVPEAAGTSVRPAPAPRAEETRFGRALAGGPQPQAAPLRPAAESERAPAPAPAPSAPVPVGIGSNAAAAAAAASAAAMRQIGAPAPAPAEPSGPRDDLTRIRAIDTTLADRLVAVGVRRFAQIAEWSAADVARANQALGFVGRIEQENWIEQAQILSRGGDTDYSRRKQRGDEPRTPSAMPRPMHGAAAAANAAAAAAVASALAPSTRAAASADRLHRIHGIDPQIESALIANGITRFAQIANWSPADVERIERILQRPGVVESGNWIAQAKILATGTDVPAPPNQVWATPVAGTAHAGTSAPAIAGSVRSPADLAGLRSVKSEVFRSGDAAVEPPRGAATARGPGPADDLKRIRGVGVLIEKKLNSLGVTSYEQVANWTSADIDRISGILDFKGRIERENWIEQARILATGGQTEFSRRVDRGEVDSSRPVRS